MAGFATIAIFAGCSNPSDRNQLNDVEWRYYNGDVGGTKFSSLQQINRSNVEELELVWLLSSRFRGRQEYDAPIKSLDG